jgi:ABC-type phosphate/phosphonate transport system substrate-binding protein
MMLRFALPPTLPAASLVAQTRALRTALQGALDVDIDVVVSRDYDALRQALLTGAVDGALAPPWVCAAVSPHLRVPLRTVRRGQATVASALVVRADSAHALVPRTLRAAWVDPVSVCGHLLPKAWLRGRRVVIDRFFVDETFYGSYGGALAAVVAGEADIAAVHVLPGGAALAEAIDAHLSGAHGQLRAVGVTDAVPGDGIAIGDDGAPLLAALRSLSTTLLDSIFRAERFEDAPPGAWDALAAVTSPEFSP